MSDPRFRPGEVDVRRASSRRRQVVARRPKVPRIVWWPAAIALFAVGALLTWSFGDDATVWAIIAGGGGFVVIGMLLVEVLWERRRARAEALDERAG